MAAQDIKPSAVTPLSKSNRPKAYLFDVFGTVVDWRGFLTDFLAEQSSNALLELQNDGKDDAAQNELIKRAKVMTREDWGNIAADWHNTYIQFTRGYVPQPDAAFPTVDDHLTPALRKILAARELTGLWADDENFTTQSMGARPDIRTISRSWHYFTPWPDAAEGLDLLADLDNPSGTEPPAPRAITCTLGNGNLSLLKDIRDTFELRFTHLLSAESFKAYKPHSSVYLGAAEKLGLRPEDCAMVAAHLGDLKAAKSNGLRTIYVEREDEEAFSAEEISKARHEGFVDIWIELHDDGFLEVARRLGLGRA